MRFHFSRLSKRPRDFLSPLRNLAARFPPLTSLEKTAFAGLAAMLMVGGALRAWERSGVSIGPVSDWGTLREWMVGARDDEAAWACIDEEPAWAGRNAGAEARRAIVTAGATARATAGSGKKTVPARPVDLNAADERALRTLPGVGPSTAKAILAYRVQHGKFGSVEDLLAIKGIGTKKLELLRPHVRVAGQRADSTANPSGTAFARNPTAPPKIESETAE